MMLPSVTTVHHGAPAAPVRKPFAWSYSKLKNYETCPKRHYHYDVADKRSPEKVSEPLSDQLQHGNLLHEWMAGAIGYGKVLPVDHRKELEPWTNRIFEFRGADVRDLGAVVAVEQELAINKDFAPCEWFGRDAWYRAKADVIWRLGPIGAIVDWKTGQIVEDPVQLLLSAACMFYHYPELRVVRSLYVWLKYDAETPLDIRRDELPMHWAALWPRIEALRKAHEQMDYPPTPNRLCRRWCAVKQCPHNGEAYG